MTETRTKSRTRHRVTQSTRKTLSSPLTWAMTRIVGPIALTLWIVAIPVLFLWSTILPNAAFVPAPFLKWVMIAGTIPFAIFLFYSCGRLMQVRVTQSTLFISNFKKEITVPLSEIQSVTETGWLFNHPIRIYFRTPIEFGLYVIFIPAGRRRFSFQADPVVNKLRGQIWMGPI